MHVYAFYCLCKNRFAMETKFSQVFTEIMETKFASFHKNSETLHLQGCGTAEPCIRKVRYDTVVTFS